MSDPQGLTPEFALGLRHLMLDGLNREFETTKKVIAVIPDSKFDYKPDPNARSAWELAWHLASAEVQMLAGIADMKFTMEEPNPADKPSNTAELTAWYEKHFKQESARIAGLSAGQLMTRVDFFGAFNMPDVFYLGFVNNHSIHHRGALATYLRPMGAKIPSIYGGSYDEPWQGAETEAETTAA